ncbi:hypothetical protein COLO4_33751 [Corchorus olitorius]|uniref:Uncharacterized protein n=1 Tax=Corchorus olitorius TaxID=93759 RepID=A0A1R3GS00_9ROSI|nr:hypothetical protein COLO4_33751 [Corchorus olitorius]
MIKRKFPSPVAKGKAARVCQGRVPSPRVAKCHRQGWPSPVAKGGQVPSPRVAKCHHHWWPSAESKGGQV